MTEIILYIILFGLSIVLTFSILAQPGKQGGFSTSITGVDSSVFETGKKKKRRGEAAMMRLTILSSVIFLILCVVTVLYTK